MTKVHSNTVINLPKKPPSKLKFTTKRVNELVAPEKSQHYYYDTEVGGLAVRVSHTGSKTFVLIKKINGKPERITLGKVGAITLSEARKASEVNNGKLAAGIDIVKAKREARAKQITVGELYKSWLTMANKIGLKSIGDDECRWRLYLSKLAKKAAIDVTRAQVQRIVDRVAETKPRQANLCCSLLNRVFNHSIKQELFQGKNPAQGIIRSPEKSRERFLKPDEMNAFIEAVNAEDEPWRGYFLILLHTGQRRAAVAAMRWDDLDLINGVWTLPSWDSKNGRTLTIALTKDAVDLLTELKALAINEYVFLSASSATGHIVNPNKAWKRICRRAGIDDLRLHDLRRTVGSYLAAAGASNFVISKALGHSDLRSAQVYARLDVEPVRAALEGISGSLK